MVPFLSTRKLPPKCSICTAPARTTASTAVARKSGLTGNSGVGGCRRARLGALGHANLHAAFGGAAEFHAVHEIADKDDAAAARLEQVFGGERVGHFLRLEALAFVADANLQFVLCLRRLEIHED